MAVTPTQRRSYRHAWRRLLHDCARAAQDPAATYTDLGTRGLDSRNWLAPSDDRAETALFGALGPMAYAYARTTSSARRQLLAPGLQGWVATLATIMDRIDPPAAAPRAPTTAYRADIDG